MALTDVRQLFDLNIFLLGSLPDLWPHLFRYGQCGDSTVPYLGECADACVLLGVEDCDHRV